MAERRPNQLLIVSDEERRNDWLQGRVELPAHQRLMADGLTFNRYYTHSSPCSPSRASLYTGSYLAEHGVVDNVSQEAASTASAPKKTSEAVSPFDCGLSPSPRSTSSAA